MFAVGVYMQLPLTIVYDKLFPLMISSMIFSLVFSLFCYIKSRRAAATALAAGGNTGKQKLGITLIFECFGTGIEPSKFVPFSHFPFFLCVCVSINTTQIRSSTIEIILVVISVLTHYLVYCQTKLYITFSTVHCVFV